MTERHGSQERIYTALKERIVNCEMLPGETIYEDRLARDFGTSRTPVREALLKLRADNLVSIIARKGTFVSHITVEHVYEIFQIRRLVEPGLGVSVCADLDPTRLAAFREQFLVEPTGNNDFVNWFAVDREFHVYLVGCTKNRMLIEIYERIMDHQQRISTLAMRLPGRLQKTGSEHLRIIDALIAKEPHRIEEAIKSHLDASMEASLRLQLIVR